MVTIQTRVNKPILLPSRELTDDEVALIARLRTILHTGKTCGKWSGELDVGLKRDGARWVLASPGPAESRIWISWEEVETAKLFDVELPLGKVRVTTYGRLANKEEIRGKLANSVNEDDLIGCKFIPAGDDTMTREYLDWMDRSR